MWKSNLNGLLEKMKIYILLNLKSILKASHSILRLNKKTQENYPFKTRMKEASLLKTTTANIFKFEMIETSSQKNYLVLIQNFWIHLFVQKILGDSHGNFLSISTFEQFTTSVHCFSYTITQMMSLCLPMRIFELHYFQLFYVPASVQVLSQTSISPWIFGLFWNKDILQDWVFLAKSHCISFPIMLNGWWVWP